MITMNSNDTGIRSSKLYETGHFTLASKGFTANICISENDYKGVAIAAKSLTGDIELVTGEKPALLTNVAGEEIVLAGTIGKNQWIDQLVKEGKLDVSTIQGTWETYVMETIANPFPGVKKALVIAGSDKRGTIYGIYKVSELIGVSAWVWWADSFPMKKKDLLIVDGRIETKEPSVKYRGIFINDDEPCFGNWCREKFGGVNSKMYVHVYELILRLKGNYMWPAMWGKSINIDDEESPRLADEYGIVMGTSHHEPMMRAQKEWTVLGDQYGGHANWNHDRNREGLYRFWEDRIKANKDFEKIVTVGMRGDGDEAMREDGNTEEILALYDRIISDQREILAKHINPDVTKVPQMWVLYKEVEEFYSAGLNVPEDIILMLCDDNFGNVRHLPVGDMKNHKGGFGMYYHFDYVGGPYSYKWINNMPLQKTWEQMTMAYEYGVDKIWIVNVGDLKPMEFPIEYFLDLAYDIEKWGQKNRVEEYTYLWAKKEFGRTYAKEIASILRGYTKINGMRKPENIFPDTLHPVHYDEADRIVAEYEKIAKLAEDIYNKLPKLKKDSFYQLVLYPAKASYLMYKFHVYTAKNFLYAEQGKNMANRAARIVNDCFVQDLLMTDYYNLEMSAGKFNHMMDQAHIGQTGWRSSEVNVMPALKMVTTAMGSRMIVTVQNDMKAYTSGTATLPRFTNIENQVRKITIGNGGDEAVNFTMEADQDWILMRANGDVNGGFVAKSFQGSSLEDMVVDVAVDWAKLAGASKAEGSITISGSKRVVEVKVIAISHDISNLPAKTFVDTQGYVSMEAEHFVTKKSYKGVKWDVLKDYGRTLSSMKAFPTETSVKTPGKDAPYLEYHFATKASGKVKVQTYCAPTNSLSSETGMRYAISIDGETPQIVDSFPAETPVGDGPVWSKGVMFNGRVLETTHVLEAKDLHTLRIYMVDAGFVLQKIVVDTENAVLSSFLGPEESYQVK